MKMTLSALPAELTENGWKNQSSLFRREVNLDQPLRVFALAYLAVQQEQRDDKFVEACTKLLSARAALHKAASALLAYAAKIPAMQKATLDQIKRVQDSSAKILPVIEKIHQRTEDISKPKKPLGRGTVRIQLQMDKKTYWKSEGNAALSADDAIARLKQLRREMQKKVNAPGWEKGLGAAIDKLIGSVNKARSGGGMKPRGSGRQIFVEFDCDKKTYRVDIDIHGDANVDFLT